MKIPFLKKLLGNSVGSTISRVDDPLNLYWRRSNTGASVTETTALSVVAVYACVRILSETLASLPLLLYRRLDRGKQRAGDHPLYQLLHDIPNPEMNSFTFRETLMAHLVTWGNAYAEIEWDNYTQVKALLPSKILRLHFLLSRMPARYLISFFFSSKLTLAKMPSCSIAGEPPPWSPAALTQPPWAE
jgi:hypothetical protein